MAPRAAVESPFPGAPVARYQRRSRLEGLAGLPLLLPSLPEALLAPPTSVAGRRSALESLQHPAARQYAIKALYFKLSLETYSFVKAQLYLSSFW